MQKKSYQTNRQWRQMLRILALLPLFPLLMVQLNPQPAQASPSLAQREQTVAGPFIGKTVEPYVFTGSLLDLPGSDPGEALTPQPMRYTPGQTPKGASTAILNWDDPVAQTETIPSLMPDPSLTFPAISNNSQPSRSWPPDTNGDVGGNYYIQTVNTSLAIYNKSTGALITQLTYDDFFQNTGAAACNSGNDGDPVVVYDRFAQRWVITDFALPSGGPYYECVAVSATSDPVNGGWYMYAIQISTTAINDYPKVGVWRDAYYITFNMFSNHGSTWGGVQVWG